MCALQGPHLATLHQTWTGKMVIKSGKTGKSRPSNHKCWGAPNFFPPNFFWAPRGIILGNHVEAANREGQVDVNLGLVIWVCFDSYDSTWPNAAQSVDMSWRNSCTTRTVQRHLAMVAMDQ